MSELESRVWKLGSWVGVKSIIRSLVQINHHDCNNLCMKWFLKRRRSRNVPNIWYRQQSLIIISANGATCAIAYFFFSFVFTWKEFERQAKLFGIFPAQEYLCFVEKLLESQIEVLEASSWIPGSESVQVKVLKSNGNQIWLGDWVSCGQRWTIWIWLSVLKQTQILFIIKKLKQFICQKSVQVKKIWNKITN